MSYHPKMLSQANNPALGYKHGRGTHRLVFEQALDGAGLFANCSLSLRDSEKLECWAM